VVKKGVQLSPIRFGGTGTSSLSLAQPTDLPDGYETGTLPTPNIAGLNSAISWSTLNDSQNKQTMQSLNAILVEKLQSVDGVKIFRCDDGLNGLLSFSIPSLPSDYVASVLSSEYDICVRAGIHCAPLAHKFLGSDKTGLARLSLGIDNLSTQIDYIVGAIREIAKKH
jgi:selenocysteine lyase/cysteine desulfurase